MVFMLLGIVQLTMMQQARLMVEYAAYNACRAGIVWNMDKDTMRRAALFSLLPTFAATDTVWGTTDQYLGRRPGILETWGKMSLANAVTGGLSKVFSNLGGQGGSLDFIHVKVLNPKRQQFGGQPEIHFDDIKVRDPSHTRRIREATRLTVRVRYLYWMKIPFANWIIHMAWMAGEAGVALNGPIDRPTVSTGGGFVKLEGAARSAFISTKVKDNARPFADEDRTSLFRALWALGRLGGMYFIPLYSTYTMRMQSNPFIDNTDM
jgi:hypothetical protein